jgi:hypothetical protein
MKNLQHFLQYCYNVLLLEDLKYARYMSASGNVPAVSAIGPEHDNSEAGRTDLYFPGVQTINTGPQEVRKQLTVKYDTHADCKVLCTCMPTEWHE